jgi:transcriptional regulator with XRE-family HTH domain
VSYEEFGKLVYTLRKQRHMSQKALADAVGRSDSWVSQVERGVYPVERVGLLQSLADALDVPLAQLRNGLPDAQPALAATPKPPILTNLRRVLANGTLGNPYLFGELTTDLDPERADTALADVRQHMQANAQDEQVLDEDLPTLVEKLTAQSERAEGRPAADEFRTRLVAAYQLIAIGLSDRLEFDAAWLAAEESVSVAEHIGQPAAQHAARHVMSDLFIRNNQLDYAQYVTRIAQGALRRDPHGARGGTEFQVLDAALAAQLAEILALNDNRAGAREHLTTAQKGTDGLTSEHTVHGVIFGPHTADLCALTIALHFGDAGETLDIAHTIQPEALTTERQYEYWLATAHAHTLRRQTQDAVTALRHCEQLVPGEVQRNSFAQETVAVLAVLLGRSANHDLMGLHTPGSRTRKSDQEPTPLLISVRRARLLAPHDAR